MLIYLDSCIVIYLIEHTPPFGAQAAHRIADALAAGDKLLVSDLTRLECRAKPLAVADAALLTDYDRFFTSVVESIVLLSTAVCDRATVIRGQYRFKTPDSLHLAAAVEAGCQVFLTNDLRLSRFSGLTIEVLP